MRLLLDAHVSGRAIGAALRQEGYDVLALVEHQDLDGLDDRAVLQMASAQGRILVTFDVADFPDILREWADEGNRHAGCIIFMGIDHGEFGTVLRLIREVFDHFPDSASWDNLALFVGRAGL